MCHKLTMTMSTLLLFLEVTLKKTLVKQNLSSGWTFSVASIYSCFGKRKGSELRTHNEFKGSGKCLTGLPRD